MPTAKKMIVRSSSKPTAAPPPKKRPASATTSGGQQEDGLPDEQAPESERPTKRVRFTADLLVPDEATNDGRGEEDGTNPPTCTANKCNVGTFDRVSDEVLRTRRIVRTTRLKGNSSSAEIAPPFGGTASCRPTNVASPSPSPSSFSGGGCGTDVPPGVNPTECGMENTPPPGKEQQPASAEKATAEGGIGNSNAKATCGEIIDLTDLADSDDDEEEASSPPKKDDNAGVVFDFDKDGTPEASNRSLDVSRPTTPGRTTGREQGEDTPADTRLNPTTVANRIPVGTTPRHDDNPTARQDTTPNGRTTLVNRQRGLTNHHHPTTPLRTPVRAQFTLAIQNDTKPVRTTTPTPRSHPQTCQPGTTVKPPRRRVEDDDEDDCWSVTAVCNGKMGAPPMGLRRSSSRSSRSSGNKGAAASSSSASTAAAEAALAAVPTLETGQPTLMNWYILPSTHQRGRFVIQGDVYGSSRFVTGGSLTTSVIESGNYHEGGLVRTGNGTVYRLGCAMRRGGGL